MFFPFCQLSPFLLRFNTILTPFWSLHLEPPSLKGAWPFLFDCSLKCLKIVRSFSNAILSSTHWNCLALLIYVNWTNLNFTSKTVWLLCLTSLVPKSLTTSIFSFLHQNLLETYPQWERITFHPLRKSSQLLLFLEFYHHISGISLPEEKRECCFVPETTFPETTFPVFPSFSRAVLLVSEEKPGSLRVGTCSMVHITMSSSQEGKGNSYDHHSYEGCHSYEPSREIIHVSEKTLDCLTYLLVFHQYICCVAEAC